MPTDSTRNRVALTFTIDACVFIFGIVTLIRALPVPGVIFPQAPNGL